MIANNTIPKTIHYVWVGGASKNELALRCIESWKKYMPEYEIVEWNESNFDINMIDYTREAYEQKKWAFVSDAIRTYALKTYGGIYFDTDVELFAPPSDIFESGNAILGFDNRFLLSTGVMASVPNHPIFEELWKLYTISHFINAKEDDTINTKITLIAVDYLNKPRLVNGNYLLKDVHLLPTEYFSNNGTGDIKPVFAIHHFSGSWKTKTQLTFFQYIVFGCKCKLLQVFSAFMGNKTYLRLNDSMWRTALGKTEANLAKGKKIFKVL
jgi:hypothetical protein